MKRLTRPRKGRIIAGVSQGIANFFGINVILVRVLWLLLFLPGGLPGLVPYLVLWLVMPSEGKSVETA
jgi:phage shock protein C